MYLIVVEINYGACFEISKGKSGRVHRYSNFILTTTAGYEFVGLVRGAIWPQTSYTAVARGYHNRPLHDTKAELVPDDDNSRGRAVPSVAEASTTPCVLQKPLPGGRCSTRWVMASTLTLGSVGVNHPCSCV